MIKNLETGQVVESIYEAQGARVKNAIEIESGTTDIGKHTWCVISSFINNK